MLVEKQVGKHASIYFIFLVFLHIFFLYHLFHDDVGKYIYSHV